MKRLTGGGEFCSEGHRQKYQEEYNQLALNRLLQVKSLQAEAPEAAADRNQGVPEGAAAASGSEALTPGSTQSAGAPSAASAVEVAYSPTVAHADSGAAGMESISARLGEPLLNLREASQPEPQSLAVPKSDGREPARPEEAPEAQAPPPCTEPLPVATEVRHPEPAAWWTAPAPSFELPAIRFGELAQLAFAATSFSIEPPEPASKPPLAPPVPPGRWANMRPVTLQPMHAEPVATVPHTVAPRPASSRTIHPAPASVPVAPAPPPAEAPMKPLSRVTNQLPLTLHGIAGPAPRLAAVFNKVTVPAAQPQLPPTAALPLRPLMLLGPAPESKAAPAEPASAKPAAKQAAAGKSRPTEARTLIRESAARPAPTPEPPAAPAPAPTPAESVDLGLPALRLGVTESRWSRLPVLMRVGLAAVVAAGLAAIGYFAFYNNQAAAGTPSKPEQSTGYQVGLPIADTGWIENWAGTGRGVPKITLLRGSITLSDYRMEFEAQIERRAIGWAYRALNPRNYYVAKIEALEAGLEPKVALVRYAVIDGQREPRLERPLEMKARVDTVYKIRFEAVGGRFSVWVQDQKIEEWTDRRIGSGGIGLYAEPGEIAALQSAVNVVPLVPKY